MKIRLCIDARMAYSSGIGTFLRNLIPFFKEAPFETTLLVKELSPTWGQGLKQIIFQAPIYSIQEQLLFPIKIPPSDLFWSPHYNVPFLPIRAKKRAVTIHDVCPLAFSPKLPLFKKMGAKALLSYACHISDGLTTVSEFSKREIVRLLHAKENKLRVLTHGVDRTLFSKKPPSALKQVQQKYQLPPKFILCVGNLKPHKNISAILQAHELLLKKNRRENIVFVGPFDPHLIQVREGLFSLGIVSDEDLSKLYSLAKLLLFPSLYEGFGLPVLEAMSSECPVLSSNAASLPEVCGDSAYFIDPKQPKQIACAIEKILDSQILQNELIQRGVKRALHFSWEKAAENYRSFFQEIVCDTSPDLR